MKRTTIALAVLALLAACSKDVSFDTLETARKQAKENAEFNARAYRSTLPNGEKFGILSRGDSTQAPDFPQGDGWATIDLANANGSVVAKLKCSTVSDSVGCREDGDFKKSPYANEDGKCQPTTKVPFPVPKIQR